MSEMTIFKTEAQKIFKPLMDAKGFKRVQSKSHKYYAGVIYRNGELYISVKANCDPRDDPFFFNVVLGEGSNEMPESDWNAVALWRLKNEIKTSEKCGEYLLGKSAGFKSLLKKALKDLETFHGGFLDDQLSIFKKVRKKMNKSRKPYHIYSPNKKGLYFKKDEPISVKLKRKFS